MRKYYVSIPLTGSASGFVDAESEEEAIEKFAEECTVDDIEWGIDKSNGYADSEQNIA